MMVNSDVGSEGCAIIRKKMCIALLTKNTNSCTALVYAYCVNHNGMHGCLKNESSQEFSACFFHLILTSNRHNKLAIFNFDSIIFRLFDILRKFM